MNMNSAPFASAVMPTANRPAFVSMAIACFQAQTYEPRELLILDDGDSIRGLVPDDPRIRYFHDPTPLVLGEKQNLGCELARGEIICHWDDDDWCAPDRLETQVRDLARSGKSVTGFHSILYFDVVDRRAWHYRGPLDDAVGCSLCYRKSFWATDRFPPISAGQDSYLLLQASKRDELWCRPGVDLMVARRHSSNVSMFPCWQSYYEEVSVDSLPRAFLQSQGLSPDSSAS